ncbi:MAG: DUF5658 family protein [Acidobacteriota bacterium]
MDIYDAQSWVVAMSILALSCFDAAFTALHLESGHIREANPVMAEVLRFGGFYTFVSVKSAMTAFALAIIILHKEWRLGRLAVRWTLLGYILLTVYHGYLLAITP